MAEFSKIGGFTEFTELGKFAEFTEFGKFAEFTELGKFAGLGEFYEGPQQASGLSGRNYYILKIDLRSLNFMTFNTSH